MLIKPFYMLNESTIETDPLVPLDRNNQDLKGEDFIVINTSLIIKRNKGYLHKYANITLFLQDDVDYKASR
jgi:hypothetical protein